MDLRKLCIAEQLSSKRKVVSGFGVVFLASFLVFSVISLKGFNSSPFSWFFPVPSSSVSSTLSPAAELQRSMDPWKREEKMVHGKTSGDKINYLRKEDGILQRTHEGDSPEVGKVESFLHSDAGEKVTEKTQKGENVTLEENNGRSSFSKDGEGMLEKTQEKGSDKNASFPVIKEKIGEENHEGNISGKDRSATIPVKGERGSEMTQVGNFSEKDNFSILHNGSTSFNRVGGLSGKCDVFNGRWVRDEGKPFYPPGSCPHIEKDFNCYENGRPDDDFMRWRWQPKDCDIPSLNATGFLEKLRGKKLLFVGDSLNRNMWESLVCILRHSVVNKSRVHEASGRRDFKRSGYYSYIYEASSILLSRKRVCANVCQVSFPRNMRHPSGKRCLLSHSHPGIDHWRLLIVLYH